ncbi:hypothetical protein LTR78_000625 [Recurvomyces mirabilis]|uniref:Uncharacterized protein n=1 Tax=Recurvomyces mirabilis TaxID=574656 RepID=A0AAE0WXM0_9PEZI|nr:hypothetical protein LTR78_000625 [Recurvomyces mirabilis]KAK5162279.1 hypothetical protein LTS14_000626 [Recurvomyces mirabilis]
MRATHASVASLASLLIQLATAKIHYGIANYANGNKDHATWVDGEDACQYTYIGNAFTNPCDFNDRIFFLPNGTDCQLTGCNDIDISASTLTEVDTTNAWPAKFDDWYNAASGCEDQYGGYYVDQW